MSSRFTISVFACIAIFLSVTRPVTAQSVPFVRGDVDADGAFTVADPILALQVLFSGSTPPCLAAADFDASDTLGLEDVTLLLSFLFQGGLPPEPPFPDCGLSTGSLSCTGPVPLCPPGFPPEIVSPVDGAVLSGPFIDVRGLVGPLGGSPGLSVTVNGTTATILPSATGDEFLARNVPIGSGTQVISVMVSTDSTAPQVDSVSVTRVNLTGAQNVAISGSRVVAARGSSGWSVISAEDRTFTSIPPAPGQSSVDDIAVDGNLVFTLDATSPGSFAIYDLSDPSNPVLTQVPTGVAVGPFAGISAESGRVVVSGGTGLLTVREYDSTGSLVGGSSFADLGIGQPDVILAPSGDRAYVSTDFLGFIGGSSFGITVLDLFSPPSVPATVAQIGLVGAGFSAGSQSPANFPIESAILGSDVLVAHGGGVSRIDGLTNQLITTTPLAFSEVSVSTSGTSAFVVGTGRSLAELDYSSGSSPVVVSSASISGTTGSFTGVASSDSVIAIAANSGGVVILSR